MSVFWIYVPLSTIFGKEFGKRLFYHGNDKKRGVSMLTGNTFFFCICNRVKSIARRTAGIVMALCRYSVILVAGVALSGALTIVFARLDKEGRTALTVYAETGSTIPEEDNDMKKAQELAGATVAEEVFAMREARRQRQENIEKAKAAMQQAEAERMAEAESSKVVEAGKAEEKTDEVKQNGPGIKSEASGDESQEEHARQASVGIRYSQQDYEVLQRIVEAEAGICDTKGRILVANVVINRVKSSEFPDTITGVVYQKSQFSPVRDGSLNSCTVSPETVEAVDRALAGEDYSQGALYFMNRRRSRSKSVSWFDNSLTYLFQHDRHEFFK